MRKGSIMVSTKTLGRSIVDQENPLAANNIQQLGNIPRHNDLRYLRAGQQ
jgi:hypothetical protein